MDPNSPEFQQFLEWAKKRMREMDREAEEMCQELGLPPESKYHVLRLLYSTPLSQQNEEETSQ